MKRRRRQRLMTPRKWHCWIAFLLFGVFVPLPASSLPQYKREKRVDIQHWCGEAGQTTQRNAARRCCHPCVVVFYLWVRAPGNPTACSQGQTDEWHFKVVPPVRLEEHVWFFPYNFRSFSSLHIQKKQKNSFPQSWADCSGSHLVLNLIAKQRRSQNSFRTAGVEMLVGVSSPELEAPLKCQLSVWKRDKLSDQSGISSFIIHSEPIQSLGAQGHHALSSMPPLIIRPHQRLFGLSNQCLFNGMPSPQETTNEYFISPLIQS